MADPQGGASGGPAATSGPSLYGSLRSFWSVLLAILYTRLDLATVELQDQGIRVVKLLLAGFLAVVLLITAFFFANVWIIAAFWPTPYRLVAIGVIFAVYFFGGVICVSLARNLAVNWPGFLSQTIKELRRDVEGLQVHIAKDREAGK
jgi:uncharacterized membrane protein YqjE